MLLIHGVYKICPKLVSYRGDYCTFCQKPGVSHKIRRFYIVHVFWLPIVPLGFHGAWFCAACGKDPRGNAPTSLGLLIFLLVLVGLMSLLLVLPPYVGPNAGAMWVMRLVFWGGLAGLTYWVRRRMREPRASASSLVLDNARCLICSGPMTDVPAWHCLDCGVARE